MPGRHKDHPGDRALPAGKVVAVVDISGGTERRRRKRTVEERRIDFPLPTPAVRDRLCPDEHRILEHWRGKTIIVRVAPGPEGGTDRSVKHDDPFMRLAAARLSVIAWCDRMLDGIQNVILRPSLVAGAGSPPLRMAIDLVRFAPVVPIIGDGRYRLQPVWIEDVAEVFAVAVERPDLAGTFDIAGPDQLTWHEMVDLIERALAVTRRRIGVPVSMVRFAAHAGVALPQLSPISPDQLQMLLEGNITEANAVETVFGVRPRPFGDVVRELCAPYAPAGAGAGG